jgi:hypothetical protein
MSKEVAIIQSNYIPWKGYFDVIDRVDEFIIYDEVKYTKRDWRNRNKIKTPQGSSWLSVAVEVKGKYFQKINETKIAEESFKTKHWNTIVANYSKAKYFKDYKEQVQDLYDGCPADTISNVNLHFIKAINKILDINTPISFSEDYQKNTDYPDDPNFRLIDLCEQSGANSYLSGPAAKDYMDLDEFKKHGIDVEWMSYTYPEYTQLHGEFNHYVTVLDLIFNMGPEAKEYMKTQS